MKIKFLFILLIISGSCIGQQYDSLLASYYKDPIKMKLIQLALQNPGISTLQSTIEAAKLEQAQASGAWLNALTLSGNINEFVINNKTVNGIAASNLYPKYNVGLNIPLGLFSSKEKKIAAEKVKEKMALTEVARRQIIRTVLVRYELYKEKKEQVELQRQITDGQKTNYEYKQKQFSSGAIKDISDVNKEYEAWVEHRSKLRQKETDLMIATLELEEIIGVPLSSIINTSTNVQP